MNTLLSTRTKELEKLRSQSKAPRGKRLTSVTGLNITEDEHVLMKLKEDEEKKRRIRKPRTVKPPNTSSASSSTATAGKRPRGRPRKAVAETTQDVHCSDDELEAGIQSLQSTIDMANRILNGDDSTVDSD
jgi:AT hook motif